jgi:hypothetical protein
MKRRTRSSMNPMICPLTQDIISSDSLFVFIILKSYVKKISSHITRLLSNKFLMYHT